jgi:hypothetical protein
MTLYIDLPPGVGEPMDQELHIKIGKMGQDREDGPSKRIVRVVSSCDPVALAKSLSPVRRT